MSGSEGVGSFLHDDIGLDDRQILAIKRVS
jgi:hypothetical protein